MRKVKLFSDNNILYHKIAFFQVTFFVKLFFSCILPIRICDFKIQIYYNNDE
jgi:hypothetical protein